MLLFRRLQKFSSRREEDALAAPPWRRRETAGNYLKAAGIGMRPPGALGHRAPAKPPIEVITDLGPRKPAIEVTSDPGRPKPAIEVITDFCRGNTPKPAIQVTTDSDLPRRRSVSACEPYREVIEQAPVDYIISIIRRTEYGSVLSNCVLGT
jgi:hypothetical protein